MQIDSDSITKECAIAYENVMTQVDSLVRAALEDRFILYNGARFMWSEGSDTVQQLIDNYRATGVSFATYKTRSLPDRINPFSGEVIKCESREMTVSLT